MTHSLDIILLAALYKGYPLHKVYQVNPWVDCSFPFHSRNELYFAGSDLPYPANRPYRSPARIEGAL